MTDEKANKEEYYKEPRYECDCPVCEKKFWTCASIFHEMGMLEWGRGDCPQCGTDLRLILNKERTKMTAVKYKWTDGVRGL